MNVSFFWASTNKKFVNFIQSQIDINLQSPPSVPPEKKNYYRVNFVISCEFFADTRAEFLSPSFIFHIQSKKISFGECVCLNV